MTAVQTGSEARLRSDFIAAIVAACVGALMAIATPALAQTTAGPGEPCAPGAGAQRPVVLRPATYVALAGERMLRLQVETSVASAVLLVNLVDGNRLYDRRTWTPVRSHERCGERTIDYVDAEAASGEAATLQLVLQPPEAIGRPGAPRPLLIVQGEVSIGGGARLPLQFEEVVVRRDIGGGPGKR